MLFIDLDTEICNLVLDIVKAVHQSIFTSSSCILNELLKLFILMKHNTFSVTSHDDSSLLRVKFSTICVVMNLINILSMFFLSLYFSNFFFSLLETPFQGRASGCGLPDSEWRQDCSSYRYTPSCIFTTVHFFSQGLFANTLSPSIIISTVPGSPELLHHTPPE